MYRRKTLPFLILYVLTACWFLTLFLCSGLTRGEHLAADALTHEGAPYVFARSGPDQFDCSGFVVYCYGLQGVALPHAAEEIGSDGRLHFIGSASALRPGDIVCFDTVRDDDPSDHVGIWLGGGRFVHASSAKKKVIISELDNYYLERFTGGRRAFCPYF